MVSEWNLPRPLTHIGLDRDELLVLDWHLSGHYLCNVSRGLDIGEIISTWHEIRVAVWNGILILSPVNASPGTSQHALPMDEGTAKYLFNWLPPTFMWGTGRDCGFTLKVKLHKFLLGIEEVEDDNQNQAASDAKDTSGTDS